MEITGKIARTINGISHFAEVTMEIKEAECNKVHYSNVMGCNNDTAYISWVEGAVNGIKYILSKKFEKQYEIHIKKVCGTDCYTNPTTTGIASILGICEFLNFDMEEIQKTKLINMLPESLKNEDYDALPNFH